MLRSGAAPTQSHFQLQSLPGSVGPWSLFCDFHEVFFFLVASYIHTLKLNHVCWSEQAPKRARLVHLMWRNRGTCRVRSVVASQFGGTLWRLKRFYVDLLVLLSVSLPCILDSKIHDEVPISRWREYGHINSYYWQ